MDLSTVFSTKLDSTMKGVPHTYAADLCLGDLPRMRWNILRGDVPIPAATIYQSRLISNSRWMTEFARRHNVKLCPHGKTTMAPQLFELQLSGGAWGITVATVQQLMVCRRFGVSRILMANQILGVPELTAVFRELNEHADFDFYCLVDSVENVSEIHRAAQAFGLRRPLQVLIEVGLPGGRAGCRTADQAIDLAKMIRRSCQASIALVGIEAFEGVIESQSPTAERDVSNFVFFVARLFEELDREGLFATDQRMLTMGGSQYFDLVATNPKVCSLLSRTNVVLRSGCYLTHDSGMLTRNFASISRRMPTLNDEFGSLEPALTVWSRIQSVPECGHAIINVGKRDISYDVDLPTAERWFRAGTHEEPRPIMNNAEVTQINDQHAFVTYASSLGLRVGDLIELGISHPCTTFDKWRLLYTVTDSLDVSGGILTFF